MTAIVGLANGGEVWMGGDSAGVSGWDMTVRADEKVFVVGPFLIGFTTSFRMGQLLRYSLTPPAHAKGVGVDRFMATTFIDAVRATLKAGGWATKDKEQESGGGFLVGYRGRLFEVCGDYQAGRPRCGYAAVGCGANIALGALYATRHTHAPMARVRAALNAAHALSAGVRPPFIIHHLGRKP